MDIKLSKENQDSLDSFLADLQEQAREELTYKMASDEFAGVYAVSDGILVLCVKAVRPDRRKATYKGWEIDSVLKEKKTVKQIIDESRDRAEKILIRKEERNSQLGAFRDKIQSYGMSMETFERLAREFDLI